VWKAREYDFTTRFVELAGEINNNMPYFCRSVISQALNHSAKKSPPARRSSWSVSRTAADIDDVRESPAEKILTRVSQRRRARLVPRPSRGRVRRAHVRAARAGTVRLRRDRHRPPSIDYGDVVRRAGGRRLPNATKGHEVDGKV
jgi:UDP-N-acetyl-D-glucosamine dehydrogenase